jgi:hypothetical protein
MYRALIASVVLPSVMSNRSLRHDRTLEMQLNFHAPIRLSFSLELGLRFASRPQECCSSRLCGKANQSFESRSLRFYGIPESSTHEIRTLLAEPIVVVWPCRRPWHVIGEARDCHRSDPTKLPIRPPVTVLDLYNLVGYRARNKLATLSRENPLIERKAYDNNRVRRFSEPGDSARIRSTLKFNLTLSRKEVVHGFRQFAWPPGDRLKADSCGAVHRLSPTFSIAVNGGQALPLTLRLAQVSREFFTPGFWSSPNSDLL